MKFGACAISVLVVLLLAGTAAAGEPDWFTRVRQDGVKAAAQVYVERHRQGVLPDSLHLGHCYFLLGRFDEGVAVYRRLTRSPDRNYAAAALARTGEGYFHLGRTEKARAAFTKCLRDHPEAWLDGSVADLCRAWLAKLDGKLDRQRDRPPGVSVEEVRREVESLEKRLEELRELLRKLAARER